MPSAIVPTANYSYYSDFFQALIPISFKLLFRFLSILHLYRQRIILIIPISFKLLFRFLSILHLYRQLIILIIPISFKLLFRFRSILHLYRQLIILIIPISFKLLFRFLSSSYSDFVQFFTPFPSKARLPVAFHFSLQSQTCYEWVRAHLS